MDQCQFERHVPDSESDEAVKLRKAYACSIRVNVERLSHARK
jgi:hypothetical protein